MSSPFERWTDADLRDLVAAYPLAWIVPSAAPDHALLMPVLLDADATGAPERLVGHLPRSHPAVATLHGQPAATVLLQGPHAYVSPELLREKNWAPTWNFAAARFAVRIAIDEALTDEALQRLVRHMEEGRAQPWTTESLGERYASLRARVVGFSAQIDRAEARFKLGQDERDEIFDDIVAGLDSHDTVDWMLRFRR